MKEGNIILSIGHLVADALFKGAPQETLHEMFGALNALDVVVSEGSGKIEKVKLDSFLNILLDTYVPRHSRRAGSRKCGSGPALALQLTFNIYVNANCCVLQMVGSRRAVAQIFASGVQRARQVFL